MSITMEVVDLWDGIAAGILAEAGIKDGDVLSVVEPMIQTKADKSKARRDAEITITAELAKLNDENLPAALAVLKAITLIK